MSPRVIVLGATGMLGSVVAEHLAARGFDLTVTARDPQAVDLPAGSRVMRFDASSDDPRQLLAELGEGDVVVNCVGVIKPYIDDADAASRRNAVEINSAFPYRLLGAAEERGFTVIQIATDCVYSGALGDYDETAKHDALDVYGKTKSLGEVPSERFLNLRCSIIGPEKQNGISLLEWVLSHEDGSSLPGFTDHHWNGVTTLAFAKIVAGIISTGNSLHGTVHVVPADQVSKSELCSIIVDAYGREISVDPIESGFPINRTLATNHAEINERLWADAGYTGIPTIGDLVREFEPSQTVNATGANE